MTVGYSYQVPINTQSHIGRLVMWSDSSVVLRIYGSGEMKAFINNPSFLGGCSAPEVIPEETTIPNLKAV